MSIPLKAKLAIRDVWDKEDSEVQKAVRQLQSVLGHEVVLQPEWQLLLAELEQFYSDKGSLITIVAGCVETWCKGLTELLEDESNEEWTDTLLEHVKPRLRLLLEVSRSTSGETSWSADRSSFVLQLPKKTVYQATELFPVFKGGLINAFNSQKKDASASLPHREPAAVDDWADVELNRATGKPDVVDKPVAPLPAATSSPFAGAALYNVEHLPNAATLPRPDELLLRPPYHLTVSDHGRTSVEILGSHSPSLQLLADYLKRWCRVNHADSRAPPGVEVVLHQSAWGLGTMYDRLTLATENTRYTSQFAVNASIVLALVEGILGYRQVSGESGRWTFRRDVEFKRS